MVVPVHTSTLTTYDYVIRSARGVFTGLIAKTLTTICFSSFQKIFEKNRDSSALGYVGGISVMASTILITGFSAYKCAMRSVKEIRGLYLEQELSDILKNKTKEKAILVLQSKFDWSGDTTCQTRSTIKLLRELSSAYSLYWEKIGSIQEINIALEKLNQTQKKVEAVVILGHATPWHITLSFFNTLNKQTARKINFKAIEGSKIILMTCFGGLLAKDFHSIAGPTIKWEGTSTLSGPRCIKIKELEPLSLSFVSPFTHKDTTVSGSFPSDESTWNRMSRVKAMLPFALFLTTGFALKQLNEIATASY